MKREAGESSAQGRCCIRPHDRKEVSVFKYMDFGADTALNRLVVAGSHDAGITEGNSHANTQELGIMGQCVCGARVFDLRIAAFEEGEKLVYRAYHADGILKSKKSSDIGDGVKKGGTVTKLRPGGAAGLMLTTILTDAREFVSATGEFVILKFDKCSNWKVIAESCCTVLGDRLYTRGGNINLKKQGEVGGSVIVTFTSDGLTDLDVNWINDAGLVTGVSRTACRRSWGSKTCTSRRGMGTWRSITAFSTTERAG